MKTKGKKQEKALLIKNMGFKENLLKKIHIDKLSRKVIVSIASPIDSARFDRESMRRLLEMGDCRHVKQRDLDLYILENDGEKKRIFVLDNGLSIYHTTIEDVTLRKSPTIKEMISIRNAIKILNDKDVLTSKKNASVKTIQDKATGMLDLAYVESDIAGIQKDGVASLENGYSEGVMESLVLFSELLDYQPAPTAFQTSHHHIIGAGTKKSSGEILFGPCVIYNKMHHTIKLVDKSMGSYDKVKIEYFHQVIKRQKKADLEGSHVFQFLKQAVLERHV